MVGIIVVWEGRISKKLTALRINNTINGKILERIEFGSYGRKNDIIG